MTITELKRRLSPGTEFTGEFVGMNAQRCRPGMQSTRRKVVSNASQLVSVFLTGPKTGEKIYLQWKGITAKERDGSVFLTHTDSGTPEEFLKITF